MDVSDIIKRVTNVQEIVNNIEVKGVKNATAVAYIYEICGGIISDLQTMNKKVGEENAVEYTGST